MATMISEVYDAFIAAGAPEEKARKAAEALADYENRFTRIDSELLILKWMVGFGPGVCIRRSVCAALSERRIELHQRPADSKNATILARSSAEAIPP